MLAGILVCDRAPLLDGRPFGTTGPYEQIYGRARFEVDPSFETNVPIVDLQHAPRNDAGRVECHADIWIVTPSNPGRGNGALLYHVVNRGRKGVFGMYHLAEGSNRPESAAHFGDGLLFEKGWTIAACAWQADVPPETPDDKHLMTFDVPVATDEGSTITGPVGCEILVDGPCELHSLGSRYHAPYEVAEGTESTAALTVRERPHDTHTPIDRESWSFDRMPDGRPAIRYPTGFEPGLLYNLVYTGRDPKVMGLGFAATRDFVSALKHETDRVEELNHVRVDRAHAFGSSQSGRFLRHMLYEGFNEDEQGRQVFDGLVINVAGGGMGSFNHRFAQPSRHASAHFDVHYPTEQFPFTDRPQRDPVSGQTAGLLDRCESADTVPRIFYTNTSTEYWNRSASLIHTDLSGTRDEDVHPSVRIYHFAGTQHGPADLPSTDDPLPGNPVNFRLSQRALLLALDTWVTGSSQPPESAHGTLGAHTLLPPDRIAETWPDAGMTLPVLARDPKRIDYGARWSGGIIDSEPPTLGQSYPLLVPAVDDDGNEVAGIRLPEVSVPLGTFAGWRLRGKTAGAPWAIVGLQGFWRPFAASQSDGDERRSVEDRYRDREDYVAQCEAAARELIEKGYLLERDLPVVSHRAGVMYDFVLRDRE